MVQIIRPRASFGEELGASLGTGLSSGLQSLAQNKLQQMQQEKQAAAWQQAFPQLPPQLGQLFAQQPELAKSLLDRLEGLQIGGVSPEIQPTGTQQQPAQTGLTIGPSSQERRHRETLAQQKESTGLKIAQPQLTKIEETGRPARQLRKLSQEALGLVDKAYTGIKGKITPQYLQSEEGQELITKLNQIVLMRAQQGKGVPSRLRLALEEGSKAAIWQKPQVIKNILNELSNDPEILKDIARDQAREELIEEYEGSLPANSIGKINKRSKEILSELKQSHQAEQELAPLPSAAGLAEGQRAKNPNTGQYEYIVRNGQWEKL